MLADALPLPITTSNHQTKSQKFNEAAKEASNINENFNSNESDFYNRISRKNNPKSGDSFPFMDIIDGTRYKCQHVLEGVANNYEKLSLLRLELTNLIGGSTTCA